MKTIKLTAIILSLQKASSFTPTSTLNRQITPSSTTLLSSNNNNNRYDKELEEKAALSALQNPNRPSGAGETAAGAILGGLVLGPFGALFGASIGSQLGSRNSFDKAKKEEMEKIGVTEQMLEQAREMGTALDRGVEGLAATQDSLRTQQKFAKRLEEDMGRIYNEAIKALQSGEEEKAKELLFKKTEVEEKLKKALINCVEEKQRLTKMEENVRAIEERAIEMESILKRTVGAKALMDSSTSAMEANDDFGFSLAREDPLLQKFRDAGID
jgi:phage shock protein A